MVNLTPWRRAGNGGQLGTPVTRLRSEMDRLFDRLLDQPFGMYEPISAITTDWLPSLDICDNDKELVLCAEVPGMKPEDIDISITGNHLTISGEKREESEDENKERGYYHSERRFGSFRRNIELPQDVDADNIKAEYNNGVLTLRIPKSETQQPRHIKVNAGSGSVKSKERETGRAVDTPPRTKSGKSGTIDEPAGA